MPAVVGGVRRVQRGVPGGGHDAQRAGRVVGRNAGRLASYASTSSVWVSVSPMSSSPLSSRQRVKSSSSKRPSSRRSGAPGLQVDGQLGRRVLLERSHSCSTTSSGTTTVSSPALSELPRKMSPNRGDEHDPEAVVLQRPDGVLAGRAGAEVGPGDEHRGALVLGAVEDERRVVRARPRTGPSPKPVRLTCLSQTAGMIWSVSTSLRRSGTHAAGVDGELLHGRSLRAQRSAGAASRPVTAVAAATGGETRWVRPPLPCRPSKLRLLVLAERSPGRELVRVHAEAHRAAGRPPLGAGGEEHLVQPLAARPAPSPASSPGTTSIRTPSATFRPASTSAAARRSSIRPLVQEPRNTVSTAMSRIGVPARRPMYASADSAADALVGVGHRGRVRHPPGQRHPLARVGAPGDERRERRRVEHDLAVERRVRLGPQRPPVGQRGVPVGALRRVRPALEVGEGRLVRRDHAGPGARLDRHVADRHAGLHRQRLDGRPRGIRPRGPGRRRCRSSR